jgi:hypothetical protein
MRQPLQGVEIGERRLPVPVGDQLVRRNCLFFMQKLRQIVVRDR